MPLADINKAFDLMKKGESIRSVMTFWDWLHFVMAGLIPAIYVLTGRRKQDVDQRDKC
jgi:hypothetical protein